ncbi:lipoprotein [Metapseudomonas resinovorans]|uniref:outer membrane protein assembly factor BamE domain-containing protein n=1 Tax=Metapseudomonas resinovorans TaxID=53412 RepID=UPI000985BC2E|nr:outer membrane protein assembly factor BamE [Pseudomonas resinovorans]GLZ86039.1 lipoprotein [Pseudomonas resinovorans]
MSLRILALLSCCLVLTACNKLNQENYSKLKSGMTKAEVEQLLGSPTECSGAVGFTSCTWGDEKTFVSVQYAGEKVLMFSGKGLK